MERIGVKAMDWKLFATTYATILLAEMGDKTQLGTFVLASGGSSRWTVFLGSALALVTASAIAVLAGEMVHRVIPALWLQRGAAVLFVGIGVWFWVTASPGPSAS